MNGPTPTGWAPKPWPSFSTAVGDGIIDGPPGRPQTKTFGNDMFGAARVNVTVAESVAAIFLIWRTSPAERDMEPSAARFFRCFTTASALKSVPSVNFTPVGSFMVQVAPLSDVLIDLASSGTTLPFSS